MKLQTSTKSGGQVEYDRYGRPAGMSSFYEPLYRAAGGPVSAYACKNCAGVTRTQWGMLKHLQLKHGLKTLQPSLFSEQEGQRDETHLARARK